MLSRYGIFCRVIEMGSFTKVAQLCGYSQSAVSQTVKALEREMGLVLLERRKDGIRLTADGAQLLPYIKAIDGAEQSLAQKQKEMLGLENCTIRIGTFTSVSRNSLPRLMKEFKDLYPSVSFILRQGEYTSIEGWIREGAIDFGFVNIDLLSGLESAVLYQDHMCAVLSPSHPLASRQGLSLKDLAAEPFILLDEGAHSVPLAAFRKLGLHPNIAYEVYDDYTILAMVKEGLGVSLVYEKVLEGFRDGLTVLPVTESPKRTVGIAWNQWQTLSYAARRFVEFTLQKLV